VSLQTFQVKASDGVLLSSFKFVPKKPKAVFLLLHGSIEHARRYFHFCEYLESQDIAVYTFDKRGHGTTAVHDHDVAYFSDSDDGWEQAVRDVHQFVQLIRQELPGLKITLFGHSMGSFLVRTFIAMHPTDVDKAILCGTGDAAPFLISFGRWLTQAFVKLKGRRARVPLVHNLVYGTLNSRLKNPRTAYDFITHDEAIVDAYIADPRCGNRVTVEYAREMLKGIQFIAKESTFMRVNPDLPLLIVSGEDDPLAGTQRADFNKVVNGYQKAGIKDLTVIVYPGMRHEILNELEKEKVYADIKDFVLKNKH